MNAQNRPRLLLDVDGPLANFLEPCLVILNRLDPRVLRGTRPAFELSELNTWHLFQALEVDEITEEFVYANMGRPGWCEELPVQPGAIEGVALLREIADVGFCTSPMSSSPTWVHERERWLRKHFGPGIPLISTSDKHWIAADVLVDDRAENITRWLAHHPGGLGVWWQVTAETRDQCVHPDAYATSDWSAITAAISHHLPHERQRVWRHT